MGYAVLGARSACKPLRKEVWDMLANLVMFEGNETLEKVHNSHWSSVTCITTWGYLDYALRIIEMKCPMKVQHWWSSWLLPWYNIMGIGNVKNLRWAEYVYTPRRACMCVCVYSKVSISGKKEGHNLSMWRYLWESTFDVLTWRTGKYSNGLFT